MVGQYTRIEATPPIKALVRGDYQSGRFTTNDSRSKLPLVSRRPVRTSLHSKKKGARESGSNPRAPRQFCRLSALEVELQRKLHNPRVTRQVGDLPKSGSLVRDVVVGQSEVRGVERIQHMPSEFEMAAFAVSRHLRR